MGKKVNIVLFFTTGNPVNKEELADLREWVRAGGRSGHTLATDTLLWRIGLRRISSRLLPGPSAGDPQKIKVKVEDPKHPASAGFTDGMDYQDEMYIFRDGTYSRDKLASSSASTRRRSIPGRTSRERQGLRCFLVPDGRARAKCSTPHSGTMRRSGDEKFQKHSSAG